MSTPIKIDAAIRKVRTSLERKRRGPLLLVGDDFISHEVFAAFARAFAPTTPVRSTRLAPPYDLPTTAMAFVHGLEYLDEAALEDALRSLNRQRDGMHSLPHPPIIFIARSRLDAFMRHCPDLFSFREFMVEVEVEVDPDLAARRALAARILRTPLAPGFPAHVLCQFSPIVEGQEGPPRSLARLLDDAGYRWFQSDDVGFARRALGELARQRAAEFVDRGKPSKPSKPLLVPIDVGSTSEPMGMLTGCEDRIDGWAQTSELVVVVTAVEGDAPAAIEVVDQLRARHGALAVAVLADEPPTQPQWQPWIAVKDRERVNLQALREAGLGDLDLWRLGQLGLLYMRFEARMRLAEALREGMAGSLDDLAIVEVALDRRSDPAEEDRALARWLEPSPDEHDATSEAEGLLLASRALLRGDWEERLIGGGLLANPRIVAPLRLALERHFHTHGDSWWYTKISPLLATRERFEERASLTIAAYTAAISGFADEALATLHARAVALQLELEDSEDSTHDDLREALRAGFHRKARFDEARVKIAAPRSNSDEPPTMTSQAKRRLSTLVRTFRAQLLESLGNALDSAYRPSLSRDQAGLRVDALHRRDRLFEWVEEKQRAGGKERDFVFEAVKEAAYTLFNRVVILRILEATGLRSPAVVTGGYRSPGYRDFREVAPALVADDESEGYGFLLRLIFAELAVDLPGLFGSGGVADLIPIPARTLRDLVEALADPELDSCWTDDMTLGWVYQYWNDPEREALDAKLAEGGKVEAHEIASKTQMFTERYMVEWLLHNSLGLMWMAICQHDEHRWTPEVESSGTLRELEQRRKQWRDERKADRIALTELMPLHGELERHWAYYVVGQPIPADMVRLAPESIRDIRILDPAVGSGHFLIVAFDLLVGLYREEARHRGEVGGAKWVDRAIVERILEHNLAGVDLDPRAVQIAAAALWLKARQACPDARPRQINLVASKLELARLRDDDPALVELRAAIRRDSGIPGRLTDEIIHALRGADHMGTLLRVDEAVSRAIESYEHERLGQAELDLRLGPPKVEQVELPLAEGARENIESQLGAFLAMHTAGDELGLRLRGQQLARGVRFIKIVQPDSYDLVVGNPPYQGTTKMADAGAVQDAYPHGKADLYAAFLLRGLELARPGGLSALLTMRNWMFINQYAKLRGWLLENYDLRAIGDFAIGAFDEVPNDVLSVAVSVFRKAEPSGEGSVAIQPTPPEDRSYDRERTKRKRAATRVAERISFLPEALRVVPEWPLVYWWDSEHLKLYDSAPKLGDVYPIREGLGTRDDTRFLRCWWEVQYSKIWISQEFHTPKIDVAWVPFVKGGEDRRWIEPMINIVLWRWRGAAIANFARSRFGRGATLYYRQGVAVSVIGADFGARVHRFSGIFGSTGTSAFPAQPGVLVTILCSRRVQRVVEELNPSIHFQINDINRVPLFPFINADTIFAIIESAFTEHESHREPSVEFRQPGPSPWTAAQAWAQKAVDRPEGAPLPAYQPTYEPEPATDHLSYALGVALGRFHPSGEGILDPAKADLEHALPGGILFLDGLLEPEDERDGLGQPATALLRATWNERSGEVASARGDLRSWLRLDFFSLHRSMYENRPIHWPLSSSGRTFVAWINIHRWTEQTLQLLLADHLRPLELRLEGELADLRAVREGGDKKASKSVTKQFDKLRKAREELAEFIADLQRCADQGPPPVEGKCRPREVDARYVPELDDGVMINSAALWPVLVPQWKDPKKWWKELANAEGKRDYDWARLAMRYWPTRVDAKCQADPSLAVAHGCFWRYHPARAWAWELRLQHEIGPEFRIEEPPYRPGGRELDPADPGDVVHRATYLRDEPGKAIEAIESEARRRMGRGEARKIVAELRILERGLWSAVPAEIWAMELRILDKQSSEFCLCAPDEIEARAAFVAANPALSKQREHLLDELAGQREMGFSPEEPTEDQESDPMDASADD